MTCALEALDLWFPGPLVEVDDKLVRADIGSYTMPRVLDLIENSRNSSLREWGRERAYQLNLMQWHGGPLVRLENGGLRVTLAPTLRGQVRQIEYKGRPLLHVGAFGDDGYPLTGGSLSNVRGDRVYEVVGEPSATAARLTADAGVEMWSPRAKAAVTLDVELPSPTTIQITAHAEPEAKGGWKRTDCMVVTTYKADLRDFRVEIDATTTAESDVGTVRSWTPVDLSSESTHAATAVRVRFPDGVVVIDEYRAASPPEVTVKREPGKGLLHVNVHTGPVKLTRGATNRYLDRKITVTHPGHDEK